MYLASFSVNHLFSLPQTFSDLPYSDSLRLNFPQYLMRCPLWTSPGLYPFLLAILAASFLSSLFWYLHCLIPVYQVVLSLLVGTFYSNDSHIDLLCTSKEECAIVAED